MRRESAGVDALGASKALGRAGNSLVPSLVSVGELSMGMPFQGSWTNFATGVRDGGPAS